MSEAAEGRFKNLGGDGVEAMGTDHAAASGKYKEQSGSAACSDCPPGTASPAGALSNASLLSHPL
jgi:hypothetical protein